MKFLKSNLISALFLTTALIAPQTASAQSTSCSVEPLAGEIEHTMPYPAPGRFQDIIFLDNYPAAKCNDGSSAAYIIREGHGAAKSRWIIGLDGGGNCTTPEACAKRRDDDLKGPTLTPPQPVKNWTTTDFLREDPSSEYMGQGIFSDNPLENPDFYDATAVKLIYCSSDYWSGDKKGTGKPTTSNKDDINQWHFRGRAIFQAAMKDLQTRGLMDADEVIFAGTSAGGVGVSYLTSDLKKNIPSDVRFVALNDGGYILNVGAHDPTKPSPHVSPSDPTGVEQSLISASAMWGGRGDLNCTLNSAVTDKSECYKSEFLYQSGAISVPTFIHHNLRDKTSLGSNKAPLKTDPTSPANPRSAAYIEWFAGQMKGALEQSYPAHSVFSANSYEHVEVARTKGFKEPYTFNGVTTTIKQELGLWYKNPCASKKLVQEPNQAP